MCDSNRFGLAGAHVTVSTVGVVPRMRQMRCDMPAVNLALSLHAPDQATRAKIVPSARQWHIDDLMVVLREHLSSGKRVLIEYVVIKDLNDSVDMGRRLGRLLEGMDVTLNLVRMGLGHTMG